MGRSRKPEAEIIKTVSINLKQSTLDKIALEGKVKTVIENIIKEKYEK